MTASNTALAVAEQQHRILPDRLRAHIDPQFERYTHVRLICLQIVMAIMDPDVRVVIIETQRQIGKTWSAQAVIVWLLEWFPTIQIGVVSYSQSVSMRTGRVVRNMFEANPDKLATRLSPDSRAKHRFNTVEGGGLVCTSVGGSVTSTTMNVVFFDDVHKDWREAQSLAARLKVWLTWEVDVQGAMSDHTYVDSEGNETLIPQTVVTFGTRYHVEDFLHQIGEYYEPEQVRRITIPALADPNVVDPDPLGREPGEPACPERFSQAEMEERRERIDPIIWSTQYQCTAVGVTGGTIDGDFWVWADTAPPMPEREITLSSWDLTFKNTGTSWCVGQLWCATPHKKYPGMFDYWLLDQVRRKLEYIDQRKMMREQCRVWEQKQLCKLHLVEDKANGTAMLSDLRSPWIEPDTGKRWAPMSNLVEVTPAESKLVRARIALPSIKDGRVHIPAWWEAQTARWVGDSGDDEAHSFPQSLVTEGRNVGQGGGTDDEIDTATQAITWFDENIAGGGGGAPKSVDTDGWSTR